MSGKVKGLLERLKDKEEVIVAEGYLFEFERRGYLKAGAFVPEVVIDHPELVKQLHEEFVHCGSDVVQAFTYYAHREKMRLIGREDELELINRKALKIARQVADDTGTLMAGNISNSTFYDPNSPAALEEVKASFKEQVQWAAEEGADFIIGETYGSLGEAMMALEAIKAYGKGLPAVVTVWPGGRNRTSDGMTPAEACRRLEEAGADVVGLNCMQGPDTILPVIKEVRQLCKGPVACLPVPYRTNEKEKVFVELTNPDNGDEVFPLDLDALLCTRSRLTQMTHELKEAGALYMGLCCGNRPAYIRAMAEALGRSPPASRYTADMSLHFSRRKEERYRHDNEDFNVNLHTK